MVDVYNLVKTIPNIILPMQNPVFTETIVLSRCLSPIPNSQ